MQDDSKKHSLQTLLERIQSGEIDATNIEEDMGRVKKAEGGSLLLDDRESYAEGKEVVDRKISKFVRKYAITPHLMDVDFFKNPSFDKWVQATKAANEAGTPIPYVAPIVSDSIEALKVGYDSFVDEIKGKRKSKQEGGIADQMETLMPEEPTHTMPDGTEMAGATHGEYEEQMEGLMDKETPMLPDEEMEEDYVNYVIEETLPSEDRNYLISALEKDDRLSEIFDQVVESATEFSGEGPVDGPGTEKSDSIPARLSDGEFVFTAKAVEEIGVDTLTSMMKDAEAEAEQRQGAAYGGMIEDEGDPKAAPIQTTGLLSAQGNIPSVVQPNKEIDEEMLKASPRRYYVPLSG
jgi:hypothetical protein